MITQTLSSLFALIVSGALAALAWKQHRTYKSQADSLAALLTLAHLLTDIANQKQEIIQYWDSQLQKLSCAYNQYTNISMEHLVHIDNCAKYTLMCLRPYLATVQRNCAETDDFEEAQKCIKIINEMDQLITHCIDLKGGRK